MGNVEHPSGIANLFMFFDQGAVVDRHIPTGKVDDFGAGIKMFLIERGLLSQRCLLRIRELARVQYYLFAPPFDSIYKVSSGLKRSYPPDSSSVSSRVFSLGRHKKTESEGRFLLY